MMYLMDVLVEELVVHRPVSIEGPHFRYQSKEYEMSRSLKEPRSIEYVCPGAMEIYVSLSSQPIGSTSNNDLIEENQRQQLLELIKVDRNVDFFLYLVLSHKFGSSSQIHEDKEPSIAKIKEVQHGSSPNEIQGQEICLGVIDK